VLLRETWPQHLFDLLTLAVELLLFERLVAGYRTLWLPTYVFAYLAFCGAIFLKRWDPQYQAGLARLAGRHPVLVGASVYVAGLGLGGLAVGSVVGGLAPEPLPPWILVPLAFALLFGYPVLFAWCKAHPRPRPRPAVARLLRWVADLAIFVQCTYLLTFVYWSWSDLRAREHLGPLTWPIVIPLVGLLLVLLYLPGRIHLLFQRPESRANWIGLAITCLAAAVFACTGLTLG